MVIWFPHVAVPNTTPKNLKPFNLHKWHFLYINVQTSLIRTHLEISLYNNLLGKIKYSTKMMVACRENITKLPLSSMEIEQEDFQVLLEDILVFASPLKCLAHFSKGTPLNLKNNH